MEAELHINIDHIATLRQARRTVEPSPLEAVKILENTQAAGITTHLREDRRHINDEDIKEIDAYLRSGSRLSLTFEMGATDEIKKVCLSTQAKLATIVPEKREELTTEGGLDLISQKTYMQEFIKEIQANATKISFFLDPEANQIEAAKEISAEFIELHTGTYANLFIEHHRDQSALINSDLKLSYEDLAEPLQVEVQRLVSAVKFAQSIGLKTNLGHGLTIPNLPALLSQLEGIEELHIGHSLVANSAYYGLENITQRFVDVIASSNISLLR